MREGLQGGGGIKEPQANIEERVLTSCEDIRNVCYLLWCAGHQSRET